MPAPDLMDDARELAGDDHALGGAMSLDQANEIVSDAWLFAVHIQHEHLSGQASQDFVHRGDPDVAAPVRKMSAAFEAVTGIELLHGVVIELGHPTRTVRSARDVVIVHGDEHAVPCAPDIELDDYRRCE